MAAAPKAIRKVAATKDFEDMQGMTVPKGCVLHVLKEGPKHPSLGHKVLLVRVDNGTGLLSLMPETAIHDTDPIKAVA